MTFSLEPLAEHDEAPRQSEEPGDEDEAHEVHQHLLQAASRWRRCVPARVMCGPKVTIFPCGTRPPQAWRARVIMLSPYATARRAYTRIQSFMPNQAAAVPGQAPRPDRCPEG